MAYLRGKTYVDGDLTVEGALQVKRLTSVNGASFPYLENGSESSNPEHLVQFTSTDGGLTYSPIKLSDNGTKLALERSLLTIILKDNQSLTSYSPVLSITYDSSSIPTMYVGSQANVATGDVVVTADRINVYDYGLRLVRDPAGDYWEYDV